MNITKERMDILFNKLLSYIFDFNTEPYEYADTLKYIGFTKEEVLDELTYSCGLDPDDMTELVNELYK